MPVAKQILRLTEREAAVKVYGNNGSVTIELDSDLLRANQERDPSRPLKVSILQLQWTGDPDVKFEIVRNNVVVATMICNPQGTLTFGQNFVDNIEDESDIVVNVYDGKDSRSLLYGSGKGQLWMSLSKNSGFKQKYEPAQFGSYDDPTVSGA